MWLETGKEREFTTMVPSPQTRQQMLHKLRKISVFLPYTVILIHPNLFMILCGGGAVFVLVL